MSRTLYTNARLMDPASGLDRHGSLLVRDGRIADLGNDLSPQDNDETVDCGGRILCPGFIDMRAHGVQIDAALKGGITTLILQPTQTTLIDTDAVVERIRRRAADTGRLNIYPMGAATKRAQGLEISEIGQMQAAGAVAFTDGRKAVADARVMRRLMEYAGHFGALIVQFAEEPQLAEGGVAHEGETAMRLGLPGIPSAAEVIQIERDLRLLGITGGRLHFALLSSRAGVEAVRAAKARGARVSASVAPPYLHLNENAVEGYRSFARLTPPLRSEEDRLALVQGLADGTIDTIVSDHDPKAEDQKRLPFSQAAPGVIGLETMLALSLSLVHAGKLPLMRVLDALTSRPADLLGLSSGRLAVDAPADLTIFDPNKPWRIEREAFSPNGNNTPFDTLPVQGRVWRTVVAGRTVYGDQAGAVTGPAGC